MIEMNLQLFGGRGASSGKGTAGKSGGGMTEEMVQKAEKMGARRWQKYGKDRLYISAGMLGYTYDHYNTGNIHHAYLDGASISNSEMNRVLGARTYIDVKTGEVVKGYDEPGYSEKVDKLAKKLGI